jgi:hypothetical protein
MTFFQRMNGWQRLWVLASLLYSLVMIAQVYGTWPTLIKPQLETGYSEFDFKSENDMRLVLGEEPYTRVEFETKIKKENAARIAKAERHNAELPAKRVQVVLLAFVQWLLGAAVFYGFGWMVVWVKKGFQPTAK